MNGRSALTAVALGLTLGLAGAALYRPLPSPRVVQVAAVQITVARTNMATNDLLNPNELEVRRVAPDKAIPNALETFTSNERIRLLAPVQAGQQIVAFQRE